MSFNTIGYLIKDSFNSMKKDMKNNADESDDSEHILLCIVSRIHIIIT